MHFIVTRHHKIASFFVMAALVISTNPAYSAEAEGEAASQMDNREFVQYSKHLNKMTLLETRIKEDETRLQELIRLKNSGKTVIKDDKNNTLKVLDVIVDRYNSLLSNYRQYNEELRALMYRYPKKGEEIRRNYIPFREKSLEQIEREIGLDGSLTALKEKVDQKYKPDVPAEPDAPASQPKKSVEVIKPKEADEEGRLKLVK